MISEQFYVYLLEIELFNLSLVFRTNNKSNNFDARKELKLMSTVEVHATFIDLLHELCHAAICLYTLTNSLGNVHLLSEGGG